MSLFPCRLLDRAPEGPVFITLCFIVRSVDAVGFAGAMTSSFALTAKIFPDNVATVLVRVDNPCLSGIRQNHEKTKKIKSKKALIV